MELSLKDVIYQMAEQSQRASQPMEFLPGTVTRASPLEITADNSTQPLRRSLLYLTADVVERRLELPAETAQASVCTENGAALPKGEGYVVLNRGLAVGDRVLMLRVERGQKCIVLSRIF